MKISKKILGKEDLKKLEDLNNPKVMRVVEEFVKLCKPCKGYGCY